MSKIKILPDALVNQIAAGEVVERPASVVKELIENSLDAGAAFCSIEAEQGGMKLIAVKDDGAGMDKEDAKLAFFRHATSKIAQFSDLSNIRTFGFRGEALAAIASVSIVEMKTRQASKEEGFAIECRGGKFEREGAVGCPPGTEIIVRNLFFNTPARKKFLKMENTEFSHIVSAVSHAALGNPKVGFELKHNGKIIFSLRAEAAHERAAAEHERAAALLGKNLLEEFLEVSFSTPSIRIYGFICKPGMASFSKRHQYLFVNGRDVSDPLVSRAVCDAFGSRLPGRSFPAFVLHIDLDPREFDVNVHPRKLNVKFLEPQRIYRDVSQSVSQALAKSEICLFHGAFNKKAAYGTVQQAIEFTKDFIQDRGRPAESSQTLDYKPHANILGQIANSYILIFTEEGIEIIDQHAAHERILYEKLKSAAASGKPVIQPLIAPFTFECSQEEAVFLKETAHYLQSIGFEFDEWSGNAFAVRACPLILKSENMQKIFRELLDDLMNAGSKKEILPERILKSLACKGAVKFGMPLSIQEQEKLIEELAETSNNSTCPHGRPTRVTFTFDELEKRFYRK